MGLEDDYLEYGRVGQHCDKSCGDPFDGPNIRCNSVSPGLMMTEWGRRFPESKAKATKGEGCSEKSGHDGRCGGIR